MKVLRPILICCTALLLAGCAGGMIAPGKEASIGNGMHVTPERAWNRISGDPEIWTSEGPLIDRVYFFTGIKSGRALISGVHDDRVAFDAKMLPNDVEDLVVTTLTRTGYQGVRAGSLAPCPFGADKGFCFDLSFATDDGLEMKGMAMARNRAGTLDLFLFHAPAEYYYGALSPDVSKLFASAQSN